MTELYIAPELKIVCFAPAQNLASTYLGLGTGEGDETNVTSDDFGVDIT